MSHSGSESDSLQGSDEDGFLEDDDDNNNMVMIDHKTTCNTQILSCCTTHASMLCQVMGYSDSEDDSDYDSESDDEEMEYNQPKGKSSGKHYMFHCAAYNQSKNVLETCECY